MGRRTLPPFIDDLRGKFSKIVFSRNLAGPYFRRWVIPANPRTVSQVDVRGNISKVAQKWGTLDESTRQAYSAYIPTYKQWYLGNAENLSGFNVFTSLLATLEQAKLAYGETEVTTNYDWVTEPPDPETAPLPGPPIVSIANMQSFGSITLQANASSLYTTISANINIMGLNILQNSYLLDTAGRKIGFFLWVSNPGKYTSSNMKPMTQKAGFSGWFKANENITGNEIFQVSGKIYRANNILCPLQGQYVKITLGMVTEDGVIKIIQEVLEQVY